MNNYHLYEEIGQGKFSKVYKGRKRYTIRYVAIKSVEKSRREKVMVEVRTLMQLKHVNIVTFVNWYETRNHLWIIFEYCAGGDLARLLKQDGRLPEDEVRKFGSDICAGLLHTHSRGIICADLKPGNILFNERGQLKLADFGHAQRLEDLQRLLADRQPLPRRGTPSYMAPELLHDGGMHSFASDFWALGCVIYELCAGRPPFHLSSFSQLQQVVMWDPMPLISDMSADMQGFLASLLRKSPLDRMGWPVLRAHSFWQGRAPGDDQDIEALPVQPHLEELQQVWRRLCGSGQSPSPAGPRHSSDAPDASPAQAAPPPPLFDPRARPRTAAGAMGTPDFYARGESRSEVPRGALSEMQRPASPGLAGNANEGSATEGASAEAPALVQAVDAGHALAAPSAAAPPPSQASSLRARLGATAYTRTRELLMIFDKGVRPISRNPEIEEPESLEATTQLPFAPLNRDEVCAQSHADLEAFFTKVYTCIARASTEEKLAALRYLEQICNQHISTPERGQVQIADLVINSSLLRLILRMLHARRSGPSTSAAPLPGGPAAASPLLRARLLSLIGQLLRHATYLEPGVTELGLFDVMVEALTEQDSVLRRRSAAALGELLFYIATQPPSDVADGGPQDAGGVGARGWQVPGPVLVALMQTLLSPGGDAVAQHYAVKTVENVATQCPEVAQRWFYSPEMLEGLAQHVCHSSCDTFRVSCLATVAHLLRGSAESTAVPHALPDLVTLGLTELAPQGVPHSLQLLAALFLWAPSLPAVAFALPDRPVELLMSVVSQPRFNSGLRGRAAVVLTMLFTLDELYEAKYLRTALDQCFVAHVDRLGREKGRLVVQCVAAAAAALDVVALALLQGVIERLRQLVNPTSNDAGNSLAAGLVQALPVLLHLVSSTVLCTCILSSRALPLFGAVCELTARAPTGPPPPPGGQPSPLFQLQPLVLMFVEALSSQQGMVLELAPQMVRCLLPALATFLPSVRSEVRLLALKSFSDICVLIFNDGDIFDPASEKPSEITRLLEALLCSRVLPSFAKLLGDEPPAPSYASRLLATLLSRGSAATGAAVRELGLAPQLLEGMRGEQALTLHAALLARCLLQRQDVHIGDLQSAGVLGAVHAALVEVAAAAAGTAGHLDVAMLDAALGVTEEAYMRQQALIAVDLGREQPSLLLAELGELAHALPALATICAPLAQAKLVSLLDRVATCGQHLASLIARCMSSQSPAAVATAAAARLPPQGVAAVLQALAGTACWRQEPPVPQGLQRRLLSILSWTVVAKADVEVRSEVASGVERLLREHALSDDPAATTDAHKLISAAFGRAGM